MDKSKASVSVKAKSSNHSSTAAQSPLTTDKESSFILDALGKLLDLKFSKLETRLEQIENKFPDSPERGGGSSSIHSGPAYLLPSSSSGDKEDVSEKKDPKSIKSRASDEYVQDSLCSIKTEIVDSLSSFDNKISEFSLVLEKHDETISSVHKKIESSATQNEIQNLIPKILQLQKNLDCLLAGESETNALIDNVIPTVSKLQKDVEEFMVIQKKESAKLNEEVFPKVQKTLGDIHERTKDIKTELSDNTAQILEKSSKISKSAEDMKGKMSRLEEKVTRLSPSNRSKDHNARGSSRRSKSHASEEHRREASSKKAVIESDSESESEKTTKGALSDESKAFKDIRSQLGCVTRGIEHLEKEFRKFDVLELIEERVIPNIYSIRKSVDTLVPPNNTANAGSSPLTSIKKHESPSSRAYYPPKEEPSSRKRFPNNERKNREPTDSEIHRSRDKGKKSSKDRSSSPDSEDGEIQIMERQIDKIAIAVIEIQDKMDSWLKYSKKTLTKSDENTGHLMEKLSQTSSLVSAIHSKVNTPSEAWDTKVNLISATGSQSKGGGGSTEGGERIPLCSSSHPNSVESRICEFSATFEKHFFELSNKIDSSIGKSNYKTDEVITTTLLHRLDDLISRTKKSDSYIKSNNENTAKIFSLLKKIESGEKAILGEIQKNLSSLSKEGNLSEILKYLEEVSPRLNDLYVKILPALDEIKKANDKSEFVKREDSEHIQKILDLVEDIKEEKVPEEFSPGSRDPHINQIYNALNDLKIAINSKDSNSSRILNELKNDNSKLFGRINEAIKSNKSTEKASLKISSSVEELRKNNSTDAKTLSQMNTVLQGLKASGPAHEKQIMNSMKDLKESLSHKFTELPSTEYLTPLLKSKDSEMDFLSVQTKSLKKLIEELSDKVNLDESQNIQQLLDSTQTIILEMFSKELKQTEKNILEIGTSLEGHLAKSDSHHMKALGELDESFKSRMTAVESHLSTQFHELTESFPKIPSAPPKKANNNKKADVDVSARLAEFERKMLNEKDMKTLMDELSKYQKLSSEILNSVEDLKILTSSTPTAIHEIVPKIEKVLSIIQELPNEYLTTMAATEENLCVNLDAKIKDQHQLTLQEIFDKFDHIDSRLAVIKKYAKHGPMGGKTSSTPAHSTTSQESASIEDKTDAKAFDSSSFRQMSEMKSTLLEELQGIKDIKSSMDSLQTSVLPGMDEIRSLGKKILEEQAKGLVVEDQLEALCNTLLQPIQKLGVSEDLFGSSPHNNESSSLLNSLEDKQMQCLDLLRDLWSSFRGVLRHFPNNIVDKEAFRTTIKSAVEAATCPIPVSSSNGGVNEDSLDPSESSESKIQAINQLVGYFKKVQDMEIEIISRVNHSIDLQVQHNEHVSIIVPNVDRLKILLEDFRALQDGDATSKSIQSLNVLCEDISDCLKSISELNSKFSHPRSENIQELREFIQHSVSVMNVLLRNEAGHQQQQNTSSSVGLNIKDSNCLNNSSDHNDSGYSDAHLSTGSGGAHGGNLGPPNNNNYSSSKCEPPLNHVSKKVGGHSRKRRAGPRSCMPGCVDQGILIIEKEGVTKLNDESIKYDASLPLLSERLQPVVKLVKKLDYRQSMSENTPATSSSLPPPPPPEQTAMNSSLPPKQQPSSSRIVSSLRRSTTDSESEKESLQPQPLPKRLCVRKDKNNDN